VLTRTALISVENTNTLQILTIGPPAALTQMAGSRIEQLASPRRLVTIHRLLADKLPN
jgi:hypothetical protein